MKQEYRPIFKHKKQKPEKEESWAAIIGLIGGGFAVGYIALLVIGAYFF